MRHLKWMGCPAVLGLLFLMTPDALANPVLQHAPEGVHIDQGTPHTTVIHQAPQKVIIDWHSHDIGSHETTHYQQPAGGVALSRIHSGQPTQIFGKLTATGRVILVNGAGIHFASGSYVNVGSIIASSLDMSDANFQAGRYVFDKPGHSGARVINAGHIEAKEHGLVALIGPHIENHGLIEAQLGTVALGAGDKVTIGFGPNDQLIQFAVEDNLVNSKHPEIKRVVENEGKIFVGTKHAKQVLDQAINMDGVQHATHVTQVNGKIILHVGSAGPVRVGNRASTHIKRNSQIKSPSKPANSFEMDESEIKNHYEVLPHPQAVFEHELEVEDKAVPAYELSDRRVSLSPASSSILRASISSIPGGPNVPDVSDVSEVAGPPGGPALLPSSDIPGGPSVPGVSDLPAGPGSPDERLGGSEEGSLTVDPDKPNAPTKINTDEDAGGGGGHEVATESHPLKKAKGEFPPFCVISLDDRLGNDDPLCIIEDEK